MDQHFNVYGLPDQLHSDCFAIPSVEKRNMYHWTGNMMKERQCAYESMREVQGGRARWNSQMCKPLTQNIQVRYFVCYFDPRGIFGTSHKLRSFRAGPYCVTKLIAPALAEIKPVYYP